jgi:hypothetical protein
MSRMLIETFIVVSDIMRDNMLVNVSGLPEHFMPVDLNIEHLIGYLKVRELAVSNELL